MALTQGFTQDSAGNTVVSGTVTATGPVTDAQLRATALPVSGPATDAQLRATPLPISGTVSTTAVSSATGTITSVAASATSVTILVSNAGRKGFSLYNDSTSILKIAYAATASATAFTVSLQPGSYFENSVNYTGIVTGIWNSAAGSARVTELT